MLYKSSLHLHSDEDPCDGKEGKKIITYNSYKLIDEAEKSGFKILAFTLHDKFFFTKEVKEYALKKGIRLIPGIEKTMYKKHVIILGANKESETIKTWNDLEKYKKKYPHIIIIAAHPMRYLGLSKRTLFKQKDLIDIFELSWFDLPFNLLIRSNINKKVKNIGIMLNKPCISTSDVHHLNMLNVSYLNLNIEGEFTYTKFKNALLNNNYINTECDMKYRKRLKVILAFVINHLKHEYSITRDFLKNIRKL